jgi:hypothetical protein
MTDEIELKPCPFCGAKVAIEPHPRHCGMGYQFRHPNGATPSILGGGHMSYDRCPMRDRVILDSRRDAEAWADAWNRREPE